jgi:hypothetical protein
MDFFFYCLRLLQPLVKEIHENVKICFKEAWLLYF